LVRDRARVLRSEFHAGNPAGTLRPQRVG